MRLNNREKTLLIVLAIVGLLAAYYYLLLSPQLAVLSQVKERAASYKAKVEEMKAQMDPNHPIYAEYKTKQEEIIKRTAPYYPAVIQERLIAVLDDKLKGSGVDTKSVSFAINEIALQAATNNSNAKVPDMLALRQSFVNIDGIDEALKNGQENLLRMNELTATFSAESEYQKLMNLISAFEKDKYKIILNNLNMDSAESGAINGSFTVSFISIPKLFETGDEDYLKWPYKYNSNKSNPFSATANLNAGETAPAPEVAPPPAPEPIPETPAKPATPPPTTSTAPAPAPSKTSDFAITLRSISSDIPTVLIGRVNDSASQSYVYADNPGFENVEVQILEKDGKLYYRYKTTSDCYPSNYSDMTAFTPKTTGVIIEVISSKRTGSDDKSGINLTVINKSSKKVTVSIKNDDSSRSRVKIASTSGSVTVKR